MIDVRHLTKRFGRLTAVDDLSFDIPPGQAVGLWGANGAGKTTVLRCLLHLLPFDKGGLVMIDGRDVRREGKRVRQNVGFVPQELTFHDDLRVDETLSFYARLKKVHDPIPVRRLLERLSLADHLDKEVGDLSGGLKQRLALALALLADPMILMLDEPTASLDVAAREDFLDLLLALKKEGKTIVFSTHRLDEVFALADRVIHLVDGRLATDCPPGELRRRLGWTDRLHLTMPLEAIDPAMKVLGRHGLDVWRNGRGVFVAVSAGEKGIPLRLLYEEGIQVTDFLIE